jgi:hypothetical protein
MPDKQRSKSGQGGLVIESRPKAEIRCDDKKTYWRCRDIGRLPAAAFQALGARGDRSEMGDCVSRLFKLRVALSTIARDAVRLNL